MRSGRLANNLVGSDGIQKFIRADSRRYFGLSAAAIRSETSSAMGRSAFPAR
jgi:hypothetical protein